MPFGIDALITYTLAGAITAVSYGAMMILVSFLSASLDSEQRLSLEAERLSAEVQDLATKVERTRIAQDLHDSLGHSLTSLKLQAEVARRYFELDSVRSQAALAEVTMLAQKSLTDLRAAVLALRDKTFDLPIELRKLVDEVQASQNLPIDLVIKTAEAIKPAYGFQIYRIIQECLTNIIKYARANHVEVSITQDERSLHVMVRDDGVGINDSDLQQGGTFGIIGMRERVARLGGELTLKTGNGTTVEFTIAKD